MSDFWLFAVSMKDFCLSSCPGIYDDDNDHSVGEVRLY